MIEMAQDGDRYTFTFRDHPYRVLCEKVHENKTGIYAEVTAFHEPAPAGLRGHIHWAELNLKSTAAREKFVKKMDEDTKSENGFWKRAIENVAVLTCERYRAGEPFVDLGSLKPSLDVKYLAYPLCPVNQITLVNGDGETSKSMLALALALSFSVGRSIIPGVTVNRKCKTLYLDWETDGEENARRLALLARGAGIAGYIGNITYRVMHSLFADDAYRIRQVVREQGIEFTIFDSVLYATGGEPKETEPVLRFTEALRSLPGTRLALLHIPKAVAATKGDERIRGYGSVMYENMARKVWFIRATEDTPKELGLFNPKGNQGTHSRPIGLRLCFDDEAYKAWYETCEIADTELAGTLPLSARLLHLFKDGKSYTVKEIAELLGVSQRQVGVKCAQMKAAGRIGYYGYKGAGRYGKYVPGTLDGEGHSE